MLYEYKCINCEKVFEAETDINIAGLPGILHTCTECQCTADHPRYFSAAPAVHFKGKGWTEKGR